MRSAAIFWLAIALSIVPRAGSAQVSVVSPAAGAESSYRNTTISWNPIPGASSYHLEIDDDPAFGSPEVDVTVAGTSYTLSGERLELHGQLSWAAYVRINGTRWNAWTFSPSYFTIGEVPAFTGRQPALGIDSQNRVYLANVPDTGTNDSLGIWLRTSSDWSNIRQLSPGDSASGLDLVVDQNDVAHASWVERRSTGLRVPYYTNSSTGWNLVPIPGIPDGACSSEDLVAGGGRIDLFYICSVVEPDQVVSNVVRWTTTNGMDFTRMFIPNNDTAASVSAARDGAGNLYVASERYTEPYNVQWLYSSLQTSADGWISHPFAPGRSPALAVTPTGEWHVLRWSSHPDNLPEPKVLYSNSLRGFQTWTALPTTSAGFFNGDVLIVDAARHQLHAAVPGLDGIQLCTAAYTGLAVDTGTSWTCAPVGDGEAESPELVLAPDGTLHLAWNGTRSQLDQVAHGLAYANSLGSFLATNLTPQVSFGAPSNTAGAVTVPAAISDPDGDELAGHIHVGRYQPVTSLIEPGTTEPILDGSLALYNSSNTTISVSGDLSTQLRVVGTTTWDWFLYRSAVTLPAQVEIRYSTGQVVGSFFITSWNETGATIVRPAFVPYVQLPYSGALPGEIDISVLPVGAAMVAIGASDRSSSGFAWQGFTKTAGQTRLLLTKP